MKTKLLILGLLATLLAGCIVVPAHPSAEWFDHEEPKFKRLWIIVDSYNDSTTEQLLTSVRSFHLKIQRTFPNGLKVLLWYDREP